MGVDLSRAATPCPPPPLGIGYMPEDRCLVPQLTVEENILLPLWVAEHLDRKARLDFVYEVIGRTHRNAPSQGAAVEWRPAENWFALGPRASASVQNVCCSTNRSKEIAPRPFPSGCPKSLLHLKARISPC